MARATHRLTTIRVAALKQEGLHPDGAGLYLRITTTGTKSWIFRFSQRGATGDMGPGVLGTVSLAKAREAAGEARRQLLRGIDPIQARAAQRRAEALAAAGATTFKECAEKLVDAHEGSWRNPKHRQQWRNTLNSYVYPVLGDLPIAAIDSCLPAPL